MYSQCPYCQTIYRIDVDDLAGGRGQAMCGSCDEVFDVLATLSDELPPEPIEYLDVIARTMTPPALRQAIVRPKTRQPSLLPSSNNASSGAVLRTARSSAALPPNQRLRWWLGAAALALILLIQVVYAERDRLLSIPTYRSWAESACLIFGCEVPGSMQALDGLALVSRDIRKHPTVEGALLISATLANRSDRVRTYPMLELRLSDLNEHPVAMRRFRPNDYLSNSAHVERGMPPNTTLPVEFEVVDPGPDAVAFEFRFLPTG